VGELSVLGQLVYPALKVRKKENTHILIKNGIFFVPSAM